MLSKQTQLGLFLMISGGVIVFALAKQPPKTDTAQTPAPSNAVASATPQTQQTPSLIADIDTEQRILKQKQKERLLRVQSLEEEAKKLLAEQEAARAEALQKANNPPKVPSVQARPESVALAAEQAKEQERKKREERERQKQAQKQEQERKEKEQAQGQATSHRVQAGDTLIRLSRQYNVPVSVLAAANDMDRSDALQRGRNLKIPSAGEIAALEAKAKQIEAQKQKEQAEQERRQRIDDRLNAARRSARQQGLNDTYSVQVALAANQANADVLASRLKAAGYQVKTVAERRGVRVLVGPERSKEAATALKDKLNNDPNAQTSGAWIFKH